MKWYYIILLMGRTKQKKNNFESNEGTIRMMQEVVTLTMKSDRKTSIFGDFILEQTGHT